MKYYAVEGIGIFGTWDECKKLTHGTSRKFKSFTNQHDAQTYLDSVISTETEKPKSAKKRALDEAFKIVFYTDGSHIKGTEKMGFGIYTMHKEVEYGLHRAVDPQWIVSFLKESDDKIGMFQKVSNCTMELLAAVYLLDYLQNIEVKIPLIIRHDYEGVSNWLYGTWKAKQPYIDRIATYGKACLKALRQKKVEVHFQWVKAHAGEAGNTIVDNLAKGIDHPSLKPLSDLTIIE